MPPADKGSYRFDPKSIVNVRNRLGVSQFEMARLLGVPANTVSRWETGKATPDAHSLAAIYSFARDRGLNASFFREYVVGHRTRLVVILDFQDLGVSAVNIQRMDYFIMDELERIAPSTHEELFKAFAKPDQVVSIAELKKLKWRVWVDESDQDQAIIQQVKSDCGQDPDDTVLVICSRDGDFAELVKEMKDWGVLVYMMGPPGTSQHVKGAVEAAQWIQWPFNFPNVIQYPSITDFISQHSR